jgi:FlaA1/EpsC-like NDP-sugar epimerase
MASIPKGTCNICRVAKVVNEKIKTNSKLYAFFAIIIIELFSLKIQDYTTPKAYVEFIYPLLTQIVLFIIFVAINYNSERLRFCKRQKLIVVFLAVYYFLNIIFMVFPICWSSYSGLINYSVLSIVSLLFFATWRNI